MLIVGARWVRDGPGDSRRAASPVRVMGIGVEAMRIILRNGGWYERYRRLQLDTESAWLVRAGEAVIAVEGSMIERVGPGGFVGEWRWLNSTPPGWRVIAPGGAELDELPWESVSGYPVIAWKVLESLGRRRVVAELASGAGRPA